MDNIRGSKSFFRTEGFTLIEILIAIFILGVVLSTVYAAYTGTFRMIRISEDNRDIYGMGRMTMSRMIQDFNNMSPYRGEFEFYAKRMEFGNQAFPRLLFTSTVNLDLGGQKSPAGISTIEYVVQEDREQEEFVLIRAETIHREHETDEQKGLKAVGFPLCNRLHSLNYKFYDLAGKEYEIWDSRANSEAQKGRTPVMIVVELNLVNPDHQDHPFKFMTKVYLPVNQVDRENMSSK
ncbi:MAG: prepilin-type N-terminal cleavage/methylation domain-containing protein [Pseudomonadota bacterium]